MTTISMSALMQLADEAGPTVLDPGKYDVVVEKSEVKDTQTGKKMIKVVFAVTTGPHAKAKVYHQFVISPDNPNALRFFFRHMKALGLGEDYFKIDPSVEQTAAELIGQHCQVKLSVRKWQDEDRNNVDEVLAPVGGQRAPAPARVTGVPDLAGVKSPTTTTTSNGVPSTSASTSNGTPSTASAASTSTSTQAVEMPKAPF